MQIPNLSNKQYDIITLHPVQAGIQMSPISVRVRISDGYVNATDMAIGKLLNPEVWLSCINTKSYINHVAKKLNLSPNAMCIATTIGVRKLIWLHPTLCVTFMRWCDPDLVLQLCEELTHLAHKHEFRDTYCNVAKKLLGVACVYLTIVVIATAIFH